MILSRLSCRAVYTYDPIRMDACLTPAGVASYRTPILLPIAFTSLVCGHDVKQSLVRGNDVNHSLVVCGHDFNHSLVRGNDFKHSLVHGKDGKHSLVRGNDANHSLVVCGNYDKHSLVCGNIVRGCCNNSPGIHLGPGAELLLLLVVNSRTPDSNIVALNCGQVS
jgi:hypothetical protein